MSQPCLTRIESKIEDLKEMRLLRQREIEWIDMKIRLHEKNIKESGEYEIEHK